MRRQIVSGIIMLAILTAGLTGCQDKEPTVL